MKSLRPLLCAGMALVVACSGDGSGPSDSTSFGAEPTVQGQAKLWLSSTSVGNAVTLNVNYKQGTAPAPRVADIRISYTETLELGISTIGDGAKKSGKELTTQQPKPGLVRLIFLSRDSERIGTGVLAQLKFIKNEKSAAKFDLLMDSPIFAPAESMRGLVVGDPLQF